MLEPPYPATPRSTVTPENFSLRSISTIASYNGLPCHLSDSPMWMRISVRSPSNFSCVISSSPSTNSPAITSESVRQPNPRHRQQQTRHDAGRHVGSRRQPFPILQHLGGLPAETRKCCVAAKKTYGDRHPPVSRNDDPVERQLSDQP